MPCWYFRKSSAGSLALAVMPDNATMNAMKVIERMSLSIRMHPVWAEQYIDNVRPSTVCHDLFCGLTGVEGRQTAMVNGRGQYSVECGNAL
jgi:hypothetical protein